MMTRFTHPLTTPYPVKQSPPCISLRILTIMVCILSALFHFLLICSILDSAFFIFGDLSVKVEGNFRLKLSLFEITSTGAVCLQHLFTGPFTVYPTKKFPGMLDSTFLSRSFSDQGARIRIRKENRAQA